jgi:serine-type D-Ala-D-Ala carboxypeptidase/endopeptidase (penicillin-binding protein 4)
MVKGIVSLFTFFFTIIIFYGCSSTKYISSVNEIREVIDQKFNDSIFAHAHWGVLIESLETGEIWYQKNADKMFMPASNEKIPTAASALLTLGPEFKYETNLYYSGEIIDSILKGDLVVKGNGDPTFYTRFFNDPRDPFFNWADTLLTWGIKKIDGNIIGDDNEFEDCGLGMGWAYDGLNAWYSAESGALQFNENYVDLTIIPPLNINDTVKIIPNISSNYFSIINRINVVDTGKSSIRISKLFNSNEITIAGNLVVGTESIERSPSIHNPTLFYVNVFKETLLDKGISITGQALDCDDIIIWNLDDLNYKSILIHKSPPLKDILSVLMKKSQNLYAETMVRTMGWKKSEIGSFDEGKNVVEDVLTDFGIEPKTYAYRDGSGLSRYNFISPGQIVKILKGMRKSEYWETWREIQPIAGVDGTLKNRMIGTKAEGNVRAKTGTISNVRGISGYLTTSDGEEIVFSFLINGHLKRSKDTELITDIVLSLIADYPNIIIEIENK